MNSRLLGLSLHPEPCTPGSDLQCDEYDIWEGLSRIFIGSSFHPRFFDEQLGSVVGAIDYVGGSGN